MLSHMHAMEINCLCVQAMDAFKYNGDCSGSYKTLGCILATPTFEIL